MIKKIDNVIISNNELINEYDSKISDEKKRLKELNDVEESYNIINKKLNKCIELIGMSFTGKNISKEIDNMYDSNKLIYKDAIHYVEQKKDETNNLLNKLNELKEEIIKKEKEELSKNEEDKQDK